MNIWEHIYKFLYREQVLGTPTQEVRESRIGLMKRVLGAVIAMFLGAILIEAVWKGGGFLFGSLVAFVLPFVVGSRWPISKIIGGGVWCLVGHHLPVFLCLVPSNIWGVGIYSCLWVVVGISWVFAVAIFLRWGGGRNLGTVECGGLNILGLESKEEEDAAFQLFGFSVFLVFPVVVFGILSGCAV